MDPFYVHLLEIVGGLILILILLMLRGRARIKAAERQAGVQ